MFTISFEELEKEKNSVSEVKTLALQSCLVWAIQLGIRKASAFMCDSCPWHLLL